MPGLRYHLRLFPGGFVEKEVTLAAGETKDLGEVTIRPME